MSKIIFRSDGALFRFGNILVNENECSIYLHLPGDGGKDKYEISIHPTGRINYRLVGQKLFQAIRFVNCLIDIKKSNFIASYRLTSIVLLEQVEQKYGDIN